MLRPFVGRATLVVDLGWIGRALRLSRASCFIYLYDIVCKSTETIGDVTVIMLRAYYIHNYTHMMCIIYIYTVYIIYVLCLNQCQCHVRCPTEAPRLFFGGFLR